jgi:hypothetical protein
LWCVNMNVGGESSETSDLLLKGIVKLLGVGRDEDVVGQDGVSVAPWSSGRRGQSGDLVPGGESGGHLVPVLGCGESVATGPEMG